MKAIIEVSGQASVFKTAAAQVTAARKGRVPDVRRSLESARSLSAELTPARVDLLGTPRRVGPCRVYALAKAAERNDSKVHTDAARLEEWGLIDRTAEAEILVPCESVEIVVPLARAVA